MVFRIGAGRIRQKHQSRRYTSSYARTFFALLNLAIQARVIHARSSMAPSRTYGTIGSRQAAETEKLVPVDRQDRKATSWPRVLWRCIFLGFATVLLVASILFASIFTCFGAITPDFRTPKDWSGFTNQSFAVGFDLTAGYGQEIFKTAAVAFNNGTIIDVARAEGSTEYNAVLARLSLESSAHPTPPYYNCSAQRSDVWRQWRQYFRKRLGLPASSDVAALGDVLSQLKEQTNVFLEPLGPFEVAFITVPSLPALYLEDLVDAAEYNKIQLITLPGYIHRSGDQAQWPVSELNTAFAGNGFGLDGLSSKATEGKSSPLDAVGTNSNVSEPWSDNLLSVLFTNTALTAHVLPILSAPHFYWADGITNFSLGLSSCASSPSLHCSASSAYWNDVRLSLRIALDSYFDLGHELGRVVSYGESARNEVFDRILIEEVLAAQSSNETVKRPSFSSKDPVFAAARGAAIFARLCPTLPIPGVCFPDLSPRLQGW